MLAVHLVRLLAAAWRAPEVSEEEGSFASRFYRWFSETFKSSLLILVAAPGLIDTLAQLLAWRSLLWLSMTWRWKYLTQSNFFSTTSLAWSLALHSLFCFSQEKPLRWKEINTHTRTRTHTHIHTQTQLIFNFLEVMSFCSNSLHIYICFKISPIP